jgi:hypothetical protein
MSWALDGNLLISSLTLYSGAVSQVAYAAVPIEVGL